MIWVLLTVVAVLLVGVFAAMLAGRIGYDPMAEPVSSQPDVGLAEGFTARSISELHFDTALRGYRMDQVDEVLDALQRRVADQERELADLRGASGTDGSRDESVPTESVPTESVPTESVPTDATAGEPGA